MRCPAVAQVGYGVPVTTLGMSAGDDAVHDAWVAAGTVVALVVFIAEVRRRGVTDVRIWVVVGSCLAGGSVAARLGTWWTHVAPADNAPLIEHWLYGNRSIIGGLAGAWLGVHAGKRLTGYRARTGNLFAPAVAAGMAVGRIACLVTETPGTATGGSWGIVLDDRSAQILGAPAGVGLHPSFGYEIAFHLLAFVVIWANRDRFPGSGDLFVLYVGGYALFRFGVEWVRGNEVVALGLTRSQWVLLLVLPLLGYRCARILRGPRQAEAVEPAVGVGRS